MKAWNWKIWGVAILPVFTVAAQDIDLYNNMTSPASGYVMNCLNGQEVGAQIFLANYASFPYLTSYITFSTEYYSPDASFSGAVTADVRFYLNDGPLVSGYNSPDTLFYDSGPFGISTPLSAVGSDAAVLSFSQADLYSDGLVNLNPSMAMPTTFTVSVEFQELEGSDQVGLPLGTAPTVGYNYGDYWFNDDGTWELLDGPVPIKPYIEVDIPEPATLCLAAVGAALLAGFARRRRQ
jgi:hypothetical protein